MRQALLAPLAAVPLLVVLAAPAHAGDASSSAPPPGPAEPAAPQAAPAGASPYTPLITKGDGAYLGRDFDGAIAAYREELSKNSTSGVAHYRLGEAQLAKGELNEAEQSFQSALRFAGSDEKLRSKTLFVLADLRERQKAYDDALQRWKEYAAHTQAQPGAKGYAVTAAERIKRLEEWKKLSADAALVKERIEKRVKQADESLRKSSK